MNNLDPLLSEVGSPLPFGTSNSPGFPGEENAFDLPTSGPTVLVGLRSEPLELPLSLPEFPVEGLGVEAFEFDNFTVGRAAQGDSERDQLTGLADEGIWADSLSSTQSLLPLAPITPQADVLTPVAGDLFIVPGSADEAIALRFQWTFREAGYNNEVGVFVLDAQGRVNGVAPGESGFAYAAITSASRQVLFSSGQRAGAWQELTFQGGDRLAFYLIQNSSTDEWLRRNPTNAGGNGPVAFFSVDGVNPDGFDHVYTQTYQPGLQTFHWEDLWGGGDRDFDDVVFLVSQVGLPVPGELGQFAPLTAKWISKEASFRNEMGFFIVDDATGRIGDLMPGDAGYAAAALGGNRSQVLFAQSQGPGQMGQYDLPSGQYLGWYLIQNATTEQWLSQNPLNQIGQGPLAFFSYPGANPDGLSHVHYRNGNEMVWEDQTGGGDRDYDDLVFRFELEEPTQPTVRPKISVDDVVVGEGETAQLTVSLSESSDKEITVTFATADGSAIAGEDYTAISGTIAFAAGETKKTISISILDDDRDEEDEQFFLRLDAATQADIADNEAIITIEDNDIANRPPEIISEPITSFSSQLLNFDVADDFSIENNPNNSWRYGWSTTLDSDLILYSERDTLAYDSLITDRYKNSQFNSTFPYPGIVHNSSGQDIDFTSDITDSEFSANELLFAPGPQGQYSTARWTAPKAGLFSLDATFRGVDAFGFQTSADVHVLKNGESLFSDFVNGVGDESSKQYSEELFLEVGDIVDFKIGFGQNLNFWNDSVVLKASLVESPQYIYDVNAVDPDEDVLTYSLLTAPEGMTIDSVSGLIEWNPSGAISSQISVAVRADDGRGGFDIQEFVIEAQTGLLGEIKGRKFVDLNGNGLQDFVLGSGRTLLVNNQSLGFYNENLGNLYGQPTASFLIDPDLSNILELEDWLLDPQNAVQNGFWTQPRDIPARWPVNSETAIIYEVDGGEFGVSDLLLDFKVDNNILIWVNGEYKYGENTLAQRSNIPIGALNPGKNYIQVLRGDYGVVTDYEIEISGIQNSYIEPFLPETTIYLDFNNNGIFDDNEPFQITASDDPLTPDIDETGQYSFKALLPGEYIVREIIPARYEQTFPNSGFHVVTVEAGQVVEGINFGNKPIPNSAPIITSTPPDTLGGNGSEYEYAVQAFDLDQDELEFSLVKAPFGMTIDPVTGIILWSPTGIAPAEGFPVIVRVDDGQGGFDLQEYSIRPTDTSLGQIWGTKFLDLNGNSFQDIPGIFQSVESNNPTSSDKRLTPSSSLLVAPQFVDFYTAYDLGQVPGLPAPYGGLTLGWNDLNTLLIGGSANSSRGNIYSIDVERGADNHIVGFSGEASIFAQGAYNDGGITYGPEGVLFASRWPVNQLGQTKLGSNLTDKVIDLGEFGIAPSPGGMAFVPAGLPGEGQLKLVSWSGGQWYDVGILPDGLGTFDIVSATQKTTLIGGPEGIAYIPTKSPLFDEPSVLISEWSSGNVVAYTVDENGDPITSTRQVILPGLSGAEGALVDPLTGDFLFSTFGGGNRVVSIQGFSAPLQAEPGLANVQIYIDLNNNGLLDDAEPYQFTALDDPSTPDVDETGQYRFTALLPGEYVIREIIPAGYEQTFPNPGFHLVTVASGQVVEAVNFGNQQLEEPSVNVAPSFFSNAPTTAQAGQILRYEAIATDPDGDILSYDLLVNPEGMVVDTDTGVVLWQPTIEQVDEVVDVTLRVRDGQGGETLQTFQITVLSGNSAPTITSTPAVPPVALIGTQYEYAVQAIDPDQDELEFSLVEAPDGMTIDSQTGLLQWTPTLDQQGTVSVKVAVSDPFGGVGTQEFTLTVRSNTAPAVTSEPVIEATADVPYRYDLLATDPDGDILSYDLLVNPEGMVVDADTGVVLWQPTIEQVGEIVDVTLRVRDGQGGETLQTFQIAVLSGNSAPTITSTPAVPPVALIGAQYEYAVQAIDPDQDELAFSLVEAPDGMTINPQTGLLQWTPTPEQQGNIPVKISVSDPFGGVSTQEFTLAVRSNSAPAFTSEPVIETTAGAAYRYDLLATDPDGDAFDFALLTGPEGMTLDPAGQLLWSPTVASVGSYAVEIAATDAFGATSTQTYQLAVLADQVAPEVSLLVGQERGNLGDTVVVQVIATDNVGVETLTLLVDDALVALDAEGRATLTLSQIGVVNLLATASDAAGNAGLSMAQIAVADPSDTTPPVVAFTTLIDGKVFTAPDDIIGTASDDNLLYYSLSIAPISGGEFIELFRGTNSITESVLGVFNPTLLQNDSYTLRLFAEDLGGLTSAVETQVNVAGDLKLGNFQLSFTDLAIPVSGIPIQVTRTYDTLTSNTRDDFGYGWRMEFRDTDLRTSLAPTGAEEFGNYAPFRDGTRVYITAPGGRREGFTFRPRAASLGRFFVEFVADPGVTSQLSIASNITLRKSGNEYYVFNSSLPFNPADSGINFSGQYTLTTKEGIVYRIDAETGDLDTITDRNNNTLTFTDSSITSTTGQRVTFERDAQGRITAAIDPEGNRVTYQYDALGDLIAVTDREGHTTQFGYNGDRPHYLDEIIDPLGRTGIRSEYDENGRLKRLIDANGNPVELIYDPDNDIQQVRDQLGNVTTYAYDQRGNVLTEIDAQGGITRRTYDGNNYMLTETDPLGNTTTFTYDNDGDVLTETDPLGNVTRYTYDANGNVLTTIDPTGQTTTNTYDSRGNLTQITGQASGPLNFTYDAAGNLTQMQDGSGTTTFVYDSVGNITRQTDSTGRVTTYTYDTNGNRASETTTQTLADGTVRTLVTQMVYDDEDRLIRAIDAEGGITETIYDAAGNRIEEIDALGRSTKYVYDERGLLIATIYPDGTPADDSDNPSTRTEYDAKGQVIAEIDELGRRTVMIYDALGRQIATLYPDTTPTDNSDNPRTQTEYDAAGRVLAEIDERGNRTEFLYDAAGRLVETILPDETPATLADNPRTITAYDAAGRQQSQTDPLGQVTQFLYDNLGRPVGQVYADGTRTAVAYDAAGRVAGRTDQAGITTRYEYDAQGRLNAVIDVLDQRTTYTYDEQGNLLTQTDAKGNTTRYEYDRLGRRIATVLPLGQRSIELYDAVGNLIRSTDFNGAIKTYSYDEQNRLIAKDLPGAEFDENHTYTLNGQLSTVRDSRGTTTYEYDERDRLLRRTEPDGRLIAYSYDTAGNRTSVEIPSGNTTYTFDAQNRLKTVTDPDGGTTTYVYNAVGNLVRTDFPNSTVEIRQYDDLNRLQYIETSGPSGIIASFRYTLDETGNRTAVVEHDGRRVDYEYDDLYRLTAEIIFDPGAVGPSRIIEYTYDAVGNRLSRTDNGEGTTLYAYDNNDRLLTSTLNGSTTTYTYDNNGNTTSKTEGGATITYTWNADNRLIEADTDGNGIVDVTNRYNQNGIRVSQTVNGEETRFLIDENRDYAQVLEEYTPGGIIKVSYVYGNDLISQNRNGEKSFYHVDGLGSTRVITSMNGSVAEEYVFDSFGRQTQQIEGAHNFLFAGEGRDPNLGLDYLRARYLDTETGRFWSRDTYEGRGREPITLHKYLYANTNPVNYIDPSGLVSIGELATVSSMQSSIIAASNTIGNFVRIYNTAQGIVSIINYAQMTVEILQAFTQPSAALTQAAILQTLRKYLDVSNALSGFSAALREVAPDWPQIANAIGQSSPEMAAQVISATTSRLPKLLAEEAAGTLKKVVYLPTGPGGRSNDSYIDVTKSIQLGVGFTGGRLFGFGFKRRSGYEQPLRIDYWDGRPSPPRPSPTPLHVHYHIYSDGHPPGRTIWP